MRFVCVRHLNSAGHRVTYPRGACCEALWAFTSEARVMMARWKRFRAQSTIITHWLL